MKITNLNKSEMLEFIKNSKSISDVLTKLNVNSRGSGAYKTFRNHCKRLGFNITEESFKYDEMSYNKGVKRSLDKILVENSTYQNISRLKIRLVNEGFKDYKCVKCGNEGEWMGEEIILQLDHINGVNDDHREENLRFLCPNCHSQTKTYAGKRLKKIYYCECGKEKDKWSKLCNTCDKFNKRKSDRPSYEQLIEEINKLGYKGTGRKYGVSDNAIRKWKKLYEK